MTQVREDWETSEGPNQAKLKDSMIEAKILC